MTVQNTSKQPSALPDKACLEFFHAIIGVYSITCRSNGRKYIGSSNDVKQRLWGHLSKLRAGTHAKHSLQADFHQYGEDAFGFQIERRCDDVASARLIEREVIASNSKSGLLYNKMLLVREVKLNRQLSAQEKAELSLVYSYRPLMAKWPSLRDLADDIGVSPDNVRVMKLRDSIPAAYWLLICDAAVRRGIADINLGGLASIEAGKNGLLESGKVAA